MNGSEGGSRERGGERRGDSLIEHRRLHYETQKIKVKEHEEWNKLHLKTK